MAPATVTETSTFQEQFKPETECKHCTEDHKREYISNINNNVEKHHEPLSPYDEMLPKNESKYMTPVRRWEKRMGFVTPLRWINVIFITLFHVVVVTYFIYHMYIGKYPKWQTLMFSFLIGQLAGFGVTGGAHRYWSHRSYKAKLPLQLILMFCFSIAGQNNIFDWVRDHRVHHKYSETSADPHDVRRGFFFSHVGWLMMKKHPEVLREGQKIDMSDITSDPWVRLHSKYFVILKLILCFVLPTLVPVYLWSESWGSALLSQPLLRYMFSLNFTWSVNSFAHLWGNKPYDRNIKPVENWGVSVVAMGEGWHNYHHTFPWDYKAAELAYSINLTTVVLDMFAKIGWAYDMKEASQSLIEAVVKRRGERKHSH